MQINWDTLPTRMLALPRDPQRGVPVPWFVDWRDGVPEFRAMDMQKFGRAIRDRLCWVCGGRLGRHLAFVIGPMCAINRTSAEPPCHRECAIWSAVNCPFLSRPRMVRREAGLPEDIIKSESGIERNPGVAGVWLTTRYTVFRTDQAASGYLLTMGEPDAVLLYAEGRAASRAEVVASIDSGLPLLRAMCDKEPTPTRQIEAVTALTSARQAVETLLPA